MDETHPGAKAVIGRKSNHLLHLFGRCRAYNRVYGDPKTGPPGKHLDLFSQRIQSLDCHAAGFDPVYTNLHIGQARVSQGIHCLLV